MIPTPTTPPSNIITYLHLLDLRIWPSLTNLYLTFLTTEDITGALRYGALLLQQEADQLDPPPPQEAQTPMPPHPPIPPTQWTHRVHLGDDQLRI
jgi:hypothetical protein